MLPRATAEHYRGQQRLTVATLVAVRRVWARMGSEFDSAWPGVGPLLVALVRGAQFGAARAGAAYIPAVLAETGQDDDPVGEVDPRAFSGAASDGRPLDSLLYSAVTRSKQAVERGLAPPDALDVGAGWLDMAVQTQVADAARGASHAAIVARPAVTGYVRMLNPPSCERCALLAGKHFKWNEGFERHPRCDCRHIPASEDMAGDFRTDPEAAVRAGQVTGLSAAERRAFDDGADLGQLVNSRRGANGLTTTEGTTRRGLAGQRLRGRQRLTPDGIYRTAANRTEAVALLRANGYVL